ncbi:hypothetical protein TEA_010062 [Camellia sinensis var. sinensis]|uniref:Cupin type-1 domain-containing protein n=1 Tax=Camellia sinensis var. sinensis TaxID=542762 RepID=A0A4S4DUS8_CAMSN|nr:hypothetical protein TEA_010062 [Camellia sinensis var. sinensis]
MKHGYFEKHAVFVTGYLPAYWYLVWHCNIGYRRPRAETMQAKVQGTKTVGQGQKQEDAKSTGKKSKEGERKKAAESNRDVDKDRPYVFEDHHFTIETETQRGRVRLLPKFTERSKLLRGIENYRLAILETEPQTFVVPNHRDADGIFFVTRGEGSISLVHQDRRESFNLRCGDILRIPEGTTVYLINKSNNEKLVIMTLLQPVSIPGHFEAFFGPGGENPESYFSAFSSSLLEAALNVDPDEFRDLRELNLAIGFANFTGGSMTAPYYNSRATKIAVVANGEGYFEMACPHLSSSEFGGSSSSSRGSHPQQRRSSGPNYQKVSGRLSRGVVFIIPPGHPVITVASKNQNLQIVCFDVNALNNEKFPLAGRRNIINQLSPEAKELAFNAAAREVDEVFKNQEDEFFFEGPRQQHEREREHEYEEGYIAISIVFLAEAVFAIGGPGADVGVAVGAEEGVDAIHSAGVEVALVGGAGGPREAPMAVGFASLPLAFIHATVGPQVRISELTKVSRTEFMTPSAFIFLYENQLFLTFKNRMVVVWNFYEELVTSFEDHLLWHPDCNTNNIYITSDQDLIISYRKADSDDPLSERNVPFYTTLHYRCVTIRPVKGKIEAFEDVQLP